MFIFALCVYIIINKFNLWLIIIVLYLCNQDIFFEGMNCAVTKRICNLNEHNHVHCILKQHFQKNYSSKNDKA